MKLGEEFILLDFFRSHLKEFSVKDYIKAMSVFGFNLDRETALNYITDSPYVFPLSNGNFITRAGAFTDQYFSFTLTPDEIEKGMFITGHRLMPFVDPQVNPAFFSYVYENEDLEKVTGEFRKELVLDLYRLYGEEYEVQYIGADPANKSFDLESGDFELPAKVPITCCSIKKLIEKYGLCAGDRIVCKVEHWDTGVIRIFPEHKKRTAPGEPVFIDSLTEQRVKWNKVAEKALIATFDRLGPCASIEEQLANTFFEFQEYLCCYGCGSIENMLKKSNKIDVCLFGVETRLWYKGEDVPAVGSWNNRGIEKTQGPVNMPFTVPENILDSYLLDFEFKKRKDIEALMREIFPPTFGMTPDERNVILLHIMNRHDIIQSKYNWFADFPVGELRHRALSLYSKCSALVYDVESSSAEFAKFPQQELVILSQLYTHVNRILDSINSDPDSVVAESTTIDLSLEGMEYNLEDIEDELRRVINIQRRNDLTVV